MSCGLDLATTREGSVCRRQRGRCPGAGVWGHLWSMYWCWLTAALSHWGCPLLAQVYRGWDPIFPQVKGVAHTPSGCSPDLVPSLPGDV